MKKLLKILLLSTSILYITACSGGLTDLAQNVLYPFEKVNKKYTVPEAAPDDLIDINFSVTAADNSQMNIHAWAYSAPVTQSRVIVYLHGNGENLQTLHSYNFFGALKQLNVHFIAIDYPGLGRSIGTPNQENLVNAAIAAINWAEQTHPNSSLIVWGRSLGAAVAVQATLKMQNKIQGLVLTSGWNNFLDAARALSKLADKIPKEWLNLNTYDSVAAAKSINTITLLHHGTADTLIPFNLGKLLFEAFPAGNAILRELPGRGHNDVFSDPQLWQDVRGFIR